MKGEKEAALAALRGIRGDAGKARGASRMSDEERQRLIISIGLGEPEMSEPEMSEGAASEGPLETDEAEEAPPAEVPSKSPRVSRVFDSVRDEDEEDDEM